MIPNKSLANTVGVTVIVAVWLSTGSEERPFKLFLTTQWYKKVPAVVVGGVYVLDTAPPIAVPSLNH